MSTLEPEALAVTCARLLDERKGEDVLVLRVEGLTSLADHFVIAGGSNTRQLRAMAHEIRETAHSFDVRTLGVEGTAESGWILVDMGDVIVHLFDAPRRELYNLQLLWGDAPEVDWAAADALADKGKRQ